MPTPPRLTIQQAFVLGAGLGTRLKRLTEVRPKPLIPLVHRPLITAAFDHLINEAGVSEIIVNTHHLAGEYQRHFPTCSYSATASGEPPATLLFRHEPELLETGGGIKNIEDLLSGDEDSSFIIYNGDVYATLPLAPAIEAHHRSGRDATLILRSSGGPLHIAFTPERESHTATCGRVSDIRGLHLGLAGTHLFTGIYLLRRRFLRHLKPGRASIVPTFIELLQQGAEIGGAVIDHGLWWDLGTREQYLAAHQNLRNSLGPLIHESAIIAPDATITGASVIGPRSRIHSGASLHDTIVWEDVEIAPRSSLIRCILTDRQHIEGSHVDRDL